MAPEKGKALSWEAKGFVKKMSRFVNNSTTEQAEKQKSVKKK